MARRKRRKSAGRSNDQHKADAPSPPALSKKKKIVYDPDEDTARDLLLTLKEEEVHFWVVRGKENGEVAQILGGNSETIRKHVENIRKKAQVESRLALLAAYWQREVDKRDRIIAELKWRLENEN